MGYVQLDVVIVTAPIYPFDKDFCRENPWVPTAPDVDAFRDSMPKQYQQLLIGPVDSTVNGYLTWMFAPDGHYGDGPGGDEVGRWRERFIELWNGRFEDGASPFNVVHVRYGGDHASEHGATIEYDQPEREP